MEVSGLTLSMSPVILDLSKVSKFVFGSPKISSVGI